MAGFFWDDLQALVNGHPAAMNTNISSYATAATSQAEDFSLGHLSSLRINEDQDKPFAFPDFSVVNAPQTINLYRELEEIYRPFYQPYINGAYNNNNNSTTAIMAPPLPPPQMAPISPIPNFSNFPIPNSDPYQDTFENLEQNLLPLPQPQPLPPSSLPPPQQQPLLEAEQEVQAQGEAELPVQPEQQVVQARPRPRGRAAASGGSAAAAARNKSIKKGPVKVKKICEVKATKLFDDLWAWRKYGQKPIKGSPFPRNYYRCSSSKGCSARKQVEKSSQGIDMFTVTYTGEHTHPRPLNRIPGTCGSRNKLPSVSTHNRTTTRRKNNKTNLNINYASSIIINNNKNSNPFVPQNANNFANDPFMNAFAESNGYSPAALSPNSPLIAVSEQPIGEGELTLDELEELLEEDFNDEADQEDEGMVMIPNMAMNEDLFMGFQELGWPIPENWGNSFNPPAFGSGSSRSSGSSSNGGKNTNAGGCF